MFMEQFSSISMAPACMKLERDQTTSTESRHSRRQRRADPLYMVVECRQRSSAQHSSK